MRALEGDQILIRIYIGESDKWHHQPLYRVLVERLRRDGFAGATVFRGIEGFGARSIVHTSGILDLSTDLPVVIDIVDTEERAQRLLHILDEMVEGGVLVTMQSVRVVRYSPGGAP